MTWRAPSISPSEKDVEQEFGLFEKVVERDFEGFERFVGNEFGLITKDFEQFEAGAYTRPLLSST